MIIEFLRDFIGSPPVLNGINDVPGLIEYIGAIALCVLVISSIYMVLILFVKI